MPAPGLRRVLQVLGAVAVVVAVAVAARPSEPPAPSDFVVERATPELAPLPAGPPTPAIVEPPELPPPGASALAVYRVDARTLEPAGRPRALGAPSTAVRAELGPDGR